MLFAIVDIETTGGTAQHGAITEVAVVVHDGKRVVDTYQTLVNPKRMIPGFITGLTGITQEMVSDAPTFEAISHELMEMLEDKIFVAHNVNFDYNFLQLEFARVGMVFKSPKLCTVRLSRKAFPALGSYSLGRLCEARGIEIFNRHRAFGDAMATAILFAQIWEGHSDLVPQALKRNSGESFLPPHISKETYDALPQGPGVYYFHDKHHNVIYVGKANNIQSRFKGHFTGKAKSSLKSEIHDVSFSQTGSEFLSLLLEALEIKRLWPKFNRAQKKPSQMWGIYAYEDGNGYQRLQVAKVNKLMKPLRSYFTHAEAWADLQEGIRRFELCPKLAGVQKTPRECYDVALQKCYGACREEESHQVYNGRVHAWLDASSAEKGQVLVKTLGRYPQEEAAILFEDGIMSAYGFISKSEEVGDVLELLTRVKPVMETGLIFRSYMVREKLEFFPISS